jgi:hypothetical protein
MVEPKRQMRKDIRLASMRNVNINIQRERATLPQQEQDMAISDAPQDGRRERTAAKPRGERSSEFEQLNAIL